MTTPPTTRRVHFAEDTVPRRSPPRTPSPTHSDSSSSAASSAGPSTPPTMFASLLAPSSTFSHSASATSSPDGSTGPAQIHAAIAFKPEQPCQLGWDVAVHPSKLSPPYGVSPDVWSSMLSQPATHPPMPSMTVLSSLLPYPIHVRPVNADKVAHSPSSMSSNGGYTGYVTVLDVLKELYASLRTPLTHEEYNALDLHHQQDVARAYSTRVSRIEERKREFERSKGVKRVDLLLAEGQPMFNGLGATKRSRDVWVLNLTS